MRSFFLAYIFSNLQMLTLLILSPAILDDIKQDIVYFLVLIAIIAITNYSIEHWGSRSNEKAKKQRPYIYLCLFPVNLAVLVTFVVFVF
ncbi:hypothetical protein [Thalassobacillus sp. CUG 92003]|uniref:hypothetical protein n=1 Tax=Thalassobacillus sp. CUG 92003 TaxID=2736641 RepID=UPI0015E74632|nr:hypothetical protein [Thalassobacillus sp. CUG 92003]